MYSCANYCPLHIPDLPQSYGLLDFVETLVKQSDVFRKMSKIEFNGLHYSHRGTYIPVKFKAPAEYTFFILFLKVF